MVIMEATKTTPKEVFAALDAAIDALQNADPKTFSATHKYDLNYYFIVHLYKAIQNLIDPR
jgi:hypothetical protein